MGFAVSFGRRISSPLKTQRWPTAMRSLFITAIPSLEAVRGMYERMQKNYIAHFSYCEWREASIQHNWLTCCIYCESGAVAEFLTNTHLLFSRDPGQDMLLPSCHSPIREALLPQNEDLFRFPTCCTNEPFGPTAGRLHPQKE